MNYNQAYMRVRNTYLRTLHSFAPKRWIEFYFPRFYGKKCDYLNPQTFSEKLIWLWLHVYSSNPLIMKMEDKFEVREYVKNYGLENILNELYFCTDDANQIKLKNLPDQFVLKLSNGCKTNLICKDKKKLTDTKLKLFLKECTNRHFIEDVWTAKLGGVSVKNIPKHYICEKYLENTNGDLSDYKFYCFNGKAVAILYIDGRFTEKCGCFMNLSWEKISDLNSMYKQIKKIPDCPKNLEYMIEVAEKLSTNFPFVRVDLYNIDGKVIFGETTFFPSDCIGMQETMINGKTMGELLILPAH